MMGSAVGGAGGGAAGPAQVTRAQIHRMTLMFNRATPESFEVLSFAGVCSVSSFATTVLLSSHAGVAPRRRVVACRVWVPASS